MSQKSEVLRADARAIVDMMESHGCDPVSIETLRRLLRQNSSLTETTKRLWQDNADLRVEVEQRGEFSKGLELACEELRAEITTLTARLGRRGNTP